MLRSARLLILGVLVLPAPLVAQSDPFLGIWELSLAKSSITRGTPPLSETIANSLEPGGFRSVLSVVTDRGTSVEIHHYNFDRAFHATQGSDPRELSVTLVSDRTIDQDTRRNGQVTVHRRIVVSADGKTFTMTASGTTGGGQPYANDIRVYEKQ